MTEAISWLLIQLYTVTGDLGWAIVAFTILIRAILIPLTLPSLKAQKQMKEVQPELKKLKEKHKGDAKAMQQAQLELYKKYNINPLAGCIPQLVQLGILIVLYQAMTSFLGQTTVQGVTVDPSFYWLNLTHPDPKFVLPVLAAVTQLILSIMILPATEVRDVVPNDSKKPGTKAENKKEEDMAEMAAQMQQQMLFIMPIMIGVSAARFPAGLALYWTATTVFSIVQQYVLSGPGGLVTYWQRLVRRVQGSRT